MTTILLHTEIPGPRSRALMNRRAEIVDAAGPGGLGGTFAGNPMSCEAALAALDALAEEKLLDSAARCAGPGLARALAAGRS